METLDKVQIDSVTLWQYSLEVYPKIKDVVLSLQDEHGLNVNLLLLAGYTQTLGCAIDEFDMQRLVEQTKQWQQQLTQPFRQLRRELKATITSAQYTAMLSMELALEQEEQWRLAACLPLLPPHNVEAQANILGCLIAFNVPLEQLTPDILGTLYSIGQRLEH